MADTALGTETGTAAGQRDGGGIDPAVEVGGTSFDGTGATADWLGYGGGLTYYTLPVNAYLTAAVGAATFTIEGGRSGGGTVSVSTRSGLSLQFAAGKEWWVSKEWGLGVALQYILSRLPDKGAGSDITWKASSFGLLFSATFN